MSVPSFVKVAEVAALEPESVIPLEVEGQYLAIVRTGNEFFAVDGICTHAFCFVGYGWVKGYSLICGCHGASFDVRTGAPEDYMSPRPLATFPIRIDGNDILVALTQPEAASGGTIGGT